MTGSSKVFVGNLNFATTKDELGAAFGQVGEVVDVHIPLDRETGRPRGFAFVKFGTPEEAAEAISRFDGKDLGGRPLRVSEAQERGPGGPRPGNGGGNRRGPGPERTYRSRGPGGPGGGGGGGAGGPAPRGGPMEAPPDDFDPGWDRGNRFDAEEEEGRGARKGRGNRPKGSRRGLRAKKRSL